MSVNPGPILERLTRLHPKVIDLSLGRIERLLGRLDEPHLKLAPVVHVAGTNGKGSTVAFLRAMLEAAGRRVHVYTSPHLVRFNERIRVGGAIIGDAELSALLEECETANAGEPITFFEITTAAAFLAFARAPADVVLLETGLGGRLDATNLIPRPAACAITPVSMDHQFYLGNTLAKIAGEKAGILKAGTPCAVAAQNLEAFAVIDERARAVGADLFLERRDWTMTRRENGLGYADGEGRFALPLPALPGAHQTGNAGLAVAALRLLARSGISVADTAIAEGLTRVEWPARLQRLTRGPLVAALPPGWELWLDGGHNPAAGEALAAHAAQWARERPMYLVFGMINTKDIAGFLAPLAPFARSARALAIPNEANAVPAETLAQAARGLGLAAETAPDAAAAVAALAARAPEPARVLICGSLYLAGTILADNG
ncbi:MAG: bifunctional folylpolyglutamate synthase/dihydrofolate synthase [Rhodospirillales bacterium]|nr:bifunctional folylpolyglutamate synthase/dihydrofolate synthase [Rhodospirillales bacterium]